MEMHYDREINESKEMIQEKIQMIRAKSGGERAKEVSACEQIIQEANELLVSMDLAMRSVSDQGKRKEMEGRIKLYRAQLADLTAEMKAAESELSDRDKLFAGASSDLMITSSDQREQMMRTTRGVRSDTDDLKAAAQMAAETADKAGEIADEVYSQGERMRGFRDRFGGINDAITSVRRNLGEMSRRNITTKIIIAGIVLLLIATIIILIYIKVNDKN
eukprot:CAMPEP_0201490484 /NCGR_PEP_ID=MMETSP0151_2-20130828/26582_1 /ASSEMBLY_ACC=CAM_ASM_000257 /TAXON_ID=200890 /ORGANISM="Paramoeba atlantica, Strain 621/1 / CCAP 1560/9" /LENGTH=218 /DNA_ID=CAMNT_0047876457 /DNA_START=80 /DNA_END=736 /DNA_ORIENTATION=+